MKAFHVGREKRRTRDAVDKSIAVGYDVIQDQVVVIEGGRDFLGKDSGAAADLEDTGKPGGSGE
ncbi:hypothetical protein SDC9_148095 [bioreactor metagenome]|uniref:Uncharacterized protein n=1 Tax=bioreactor metagenome TaxID=1076179 RepID=A0A645EGL9_9ZZZZ